jgi:hypothetical protein
MNDQHAWELAAKADYFRDLPDSQFTNMAWADLDSYGDKYERPDGPSAV